MTVSTLSWAMEQPCDSPLEKLILVHLADSFGMSRRRDVSTMRLMEFCRCSPTKLLEAVQGLDLGGYIRWGGFVAGGFYDIELMAPSDSTGPTS